jgi:hypothetical protein
LIFSYQGTPNLCVSDCFLTADLQNRQVAFGYISKDPKNTFNHAFEGKWDFLGKLRGIQGWPLFLRLGTQYNHSRDLQVKAKLDLGNELSLDIATVHRLTPNFRLVCTKKINLTNLCHEPTRSGF